MSDFAAVLSSIDRTALERRLREVRSGQVEQTLAAERLGVDDLVHLMAPAAVPHLEEIARRALGLTRQHFGNTISLYAPIYISDSCRNDCIYCGFRRSNGPDRRTLDSEEIERSAHAIAATGVREVLLVSGEDRVATPIPYLENGVAILAQHFSSVGLEIFPMTEREYAQLGEAGADSLTVYQETYDREVYASVHPSGPKRNFEWRLGTPERAADAGYRSLNLGALLGLGEPRLDALLCALHVQWLRRRYPSVELSVSVPRLTEAEGGYRPAHPVNDQTLVQILLALRLFLPRVGLTLSTREPALLRDHLAGLGITRMSAGSRTEVGGYLGDQEAKSQFSLHDHRSVRAVTSMLQSRGLQPVFKNWERVT